MTVQSEKIEVRNLNHPESIQLVDAKMYKAMRVAYLKAVPRDKHGSTLDEIRKRLPALLSHDAFPGGKKLNWFAKVVQLDLEAKGIITRDKSSPLRLRQT